jgi:hypothetical protein
MKRIVRASLLLLGLCLMFVVVLETFGLVGQGFAGPIQWEIPAGYQGWVVGRYEESECAPAGVDGLFRVFTVRPSGEFCTSSPFPRGWRYSRYEYVFPDGTRNQLAVGVPGKGGDVWPLFADANRNVELFFIGSEGEFHARRDRPPV